LKKIGIYGGTFDPIHHGHLILARDAMEELELAEIIFIPAAVSPHKLKGTAAAPEARLEMLRATVAGEKRFAIDEIELQRPPPSYTIETIETLRSRQSAAQFFYLVGEDNIARLASWHRFAELRALVQFIVLDRSAVRTEHPYRAIRRHLDISGTEIRNRVATGRSIRYLVPAAVEKIIRDRQLYLEPEI